MMHRNAGNADFRQEPAPDAFVNAGRSHRRPVMSDNRQQGSGRGSAPDPRPETDMNPGDQAPPGTPGTGENVCPKCGGSGRLQGEQCPNCGGTGKVIEGIGGA